MLTNSSGEATGAFSYGAYGTPKESTGTQTTPLGYAGQLTNEQSGLQYLRARVYDPVTGQFLTTDPLLELTRQPYAYTFDNPVNGVDPMGLRGEEAEIPCVWPICGPPPNVTKGLEEVGKAAKELAEKAKPEVGADEGVELSRRRDDRAGRPGAALPATFCARGCCN